MRDNDTKILEETYINLKEHNFNIPDHETEDTAEIYDPAKDDWVVVNFDIGYNHEESGGVDIISMDTHDDLEIDNKHYPSGTSVNKLFKYMGFNMTDPKQYKNDERKFWDNIERDIIDDIENSDDIHPNDEEKADTIRSIHNF